MEVFRRQRLLLSEGQVYWGAMVQANILLFEVGREDHPALAVYGTDRTFDPCPERLHAIGQRLFSLKNTTPDNPQDRRFAAMITDEMERSLGWRVPKRHTAGREVFCSASMVFRTHLPGGILRAGWFPLLVHPDTPAIMIVPRRFWPPELVRIWSEE